MVVLLGGIVQERFVPVQLCNYDMQQFISVDQKHGRQHQKLLMCFASRNR